MYIYVCMKSLNACTKSFSIGGDEYEEYAQKKIYKQEVTKKLYNMKKKKQSEFESWKNISMTQRTIKYKNTKKP